MRTYVHFEIEKAHVFPHFYTVWRKKNGQILHANSIKWSWNPLYETNVWNYQLDLDKYFSRLVGAVGSAVIFCLFH